jgi:hypothetical protein
VVGDMEDCIHDLMDKFEKGISLDFYGGKVDIDGVEILRVKDFKTIKSFAIQTNVTFFLSNGSTIKLTTKDENFK